MRDWLASFNFWIHRSKHVYFYPGVYLQLDSYSEVVKMCGSTALQNQKVNIDFVGFMFWKHFTYRYSSGVSGDWMNPMERADFPEEVMQLCPLVPINRGAGHGNMLHAMLAGPSVVQCSSVLHLSPVRMLLGIVVWGLWQENDSVISQNVFRIATHFLVLWSFYGIV